MTDEKTTSTPSRSGGRDLVRHVPAAILLIALGAFVAANLHDVSVGFVFGKAKVPLVLVLLITAVVGALFGALLRGRRK